MAITTAALVGRVGGLAVALGCGAAIYTAAAPEAWASPTDTSRSVSAETGHDGGGPGRAHSSGVARATGGQPQSAGTAARSRVRTAAVQSAPRAPERRLLAAVSPAPANPVGTPLPVLLSSATEAVGHDVRRRLTVQTAEATAGAGSVGAQPTAKIPAGHPTGSFGLRDKYVIFKYIPFSFPRRPAFFVTTVMGSGMFDQNSIYDLHSVDQYDWNKLTGISFNFLRPDQNALMVAWRYNVTDNDFEIAPYYNVDTARILPDENTQVVKVPIGETFTFAVDYNGITVSYGSSSVFKPIPADLHPNQCSAFRIQPWFGGTSLPPRTLTLYMRFG